MKIKTIVMSVFIVILLFTVTLLTNAEKKYETNEDNFVVHDNCFSDFKEEEIVDNFKTLVENRAKFREIVEFLDSNIGLLSKENASIIISDFEVFQKLNKSAMEKKFYDRKIQEKIGSIYIEEFDLNMINVKKKVDKIEDPELRELLLKTINTGYKVETAEGMFFPVIDYDFYLKYIPYLTQDHKEYIEIMTVESIDPPAKDGALVIGWDEVVKRALAQETFLINHPESIKAAEMKSLYERYLNFTFFGLNNTPLFRYDTKEIEDEARDIYLKMIKNNSDSEYLKLLSGFLNKLKENDYILTDNVNNYRRDILDNIFYSYEFYYPIIKDTINAMQKNIDMLKEESSIQKIEESNYGDMYQMTQVLKVSKNELLFDTVPVYFSTNYKGHFTLGNRYPYYLDAAMGGQRGITVKDDFGIWHTFGWRVSINH